MKLIPTVDKYLFIVDNYCKDNHFFFTNLQKKGIMTKIHLSLTEFTNYINASGASKITIVSRAKIKHTEQEGNPYDYWGILRKEIKKGLKNFWEEEDYKEIVEKIHPDYQSNYEEMIKGYLKFWRKGMSWIKPVKKTVSIDAISLSLNPEIGVLYRGKQLMIKLYMKSNEVLDKKHASLILSLMERELREKVDEVIQFAILDVRRGKLFKMQTTDPRILYLIEAEARSFVSLWEKL